MQADSQDAPPARSIGKIHRFLMKMPDMIDDALTVAIIHDT